MKKNNIGYWILIVIIVAVTFIGYREGERKVKLAEENEILTEQISELKSYIEELEDRLEEYE